MGALKKARLYDPDNYSDGFYVQFNPNTLSYSAGSPPEQVRETELMSKPGQIQGDPTGRTSLATLTATLFFHTYENETSYTDVRSDVNRLRAFLRRGGDGEGVLSPRVAFAWGTLTVVGTLEHLSVSYQMFASDGTPVQAEVSVTILGEDPDVSAEGVNRAASVALQRDLASSWRELGAIPALVRWLFS